MAEAGAINPISSLSISNSIRHFLWLEGGKPRVAARRPVVLLVRCVFLTGIPTSWQLIRLPLGREGLVPPFLIGLLHFGKI